MQNTDVNTIIPHTIENTLFKKYKIGSRVNIETDMFARYIYNMFKNKKEDLSWGDVERIMASYQSFFLALDFQKDKNIFFYLHLYMV